MIHLCCLHSNPKCPEIHPEYTQSIKDNEKSSYQNFFKIQSSFLFLFIILNYGINSKATYLYDYELGLNSFCFGHLVAVYEKGENCSNLFNIYEFKLEK